MAGGTERHDLLAGHVFAHLYGAAPAGCRVFSQNRLVRVADATGYYPDVMVVCTPAADAHWENDATVIVEVLSSSTEDTDRREKAIAYASLAGLQRYVLLDPRGIRRVEVARRAANGSWDWQAVGPGGIVDFGVSMVDLDTLYERFEASVTT